MFVGRGAAFLLPVARAALLSVPVPPADAVRRGWLHPKRGECGTALGVRAPAEVEADWFNERREQPWIAPRGRQTQIGSQKP